MLPVTIVDSSNYQRMAAKAIKMHEVRSSVNRIAVALKSDPLTIKKAIEWAAQDDTSFIPSSDFSVRRKLASNRIAKIGPEVVQLRNQPYHIDYLRSAGCCSCPIAPAESGTTFWRPKDTFTPPSLGSQTHKKFDTDGLPSPVGKGNKTSGESLPSGDESEPVNLKPDNATDKNTSHTPFSPDQPGMILSFVD
ncbi:MAG: hypothetical protein Rhob2KO_50940 [Rhodopirellula baltica]